MTDLVQHYEKSLPIWIKKQGFPTQPMLALHHDGKMSMASLMIAQEDVFHAVITKFMIDLTIKELIFGIDRYTKPSQGTKYKDVLTVFWWQGERMNDHYGWEFGVVNYRPPPRTIIEPIDWHNAFWNHVCANIVEDHHRRMLRAIAEVAAKPGGKEMIESCKQAVLEARERAQRGEKLH